MQQSDLARIYAVPCWRWRCLGDSCSTQVLPSIRGPVEWRTFLYAWTAADRPMLCILRFNTTGDNNGMEFVVSTP